MTSQNFKVDVSSGHSYVKVDDISEQHHFHNEVFLFRHGGLFTIIVYGAVSCYDMAFIHTGLPDDYCCI